MVEPLFLFPSEPLYPSDLLTPKVGLCSTPAAVCFDPGAYGAQPARWEAMLPQEGREDRSTGP